MADSNTIVWNEIIPGNTEDASEGALRIRESKTAVREAMSRDHIFGGTFGAADPSADSGGIVNTHTGYHRRVTLLNQLGAYDSTAQTRTSTLNTGVTSETDRATELWCSPQANRHTDGTSNDNVLRIAGGSQTAVKEIATLTQTQSFTNKTLTSDTNVIGGVHFDGTPCKTGSVLSGCQIGVSETRGPGFFTTIDANTAAAGFVGDLKGDVYASNGAKVLEAGSDPTDYSLSAYNGTAARTTNIYVANKDENLAYRPVFILGTDAPSGSDPVKYLTTNSTEGITLNPSTNTITASFFEGALTGNVTAASGTSAFNIITATGSVTGDTFRSSSGNTLTLGNDGVDTDSHIQIANNGNITLTAAGSGVCTFAAPITAGQPTTISGALISTGEATFANVTDLKLKNGETGPGKIEFYEDALVGNVLGDNYITLTMDGAVGGNYSLYLPREGTDTLVGRATTDILTNKTLTTPQINDTSANHQYMFAVSELAADRTVTLPLLAGNDEFTFNGHSQTLTNKTINASNNTISNVNIVSHTTGTLSVARGGTGATSGGQTAARNIQAIHSPVQNPSNWGTSGSGIQSTGINFITLDCNGLKDADGDNGSVYMVVGSYNPYNNVNFGVRADFESDERLKENIVDYDKSALDLLNKTKLRKFNWKRSGMKSYGFVAQEIEKVLPELVDPVRQPEGSEFSEHLMVNHPRLALLLVKAVQELTAEVNALKAA